MGPQGERCMVASGRTGGIETQGCLDAIASGEGREVFVLNANSQLESVVDGRCVALANGDVEAGILTLEDCGLATDAADGRAEFEFSADGQLRFLHMTNYCVALSPTGASVKDCSAADTAVLQAAVPEHDATP